MSRRILYILYVILIKFVSLCSCSMSYIDITTDQGVVRGYNSSNEYIYEFYGIPFATAPKGLFKFQVGIYIYYKVQLYPLVIMVVY